MAEAKEQSETGADKAPPELSEAIRAEVEALGGAERAAVIMLLLGEQQAAEII